jgi:hypothetical protein
VRATLIALGLVIATASVTNSVSAATLTYDNILGSWCGVNTNPHWVNAIFSRDSLTAIFLPNNSKTVFKIDHYEFTDTMVSVRYVKADKTVTTVIYIDFSADDQTMIQAATDQSAIYHFTRCKL